jgi:hypothetical protein
VVLLGTFHPKSAAAEHRAAWRRPRSGQELR